MKMKPLTPPAGPGNPASPASGDEIHQDRLVVDFVIQSDIISLFNIKVQPGFRTWAEAAALARQLQDVGSNCRVMQRTMVGGLLVSLESTPDELL